MNIGSNPRRGIARAIFLILLAGTAALCLRGALPRSEAAAPENTDAAEGAWKETPATPAEEKTPAERRGDVYTIILAGMDEVSGNTDTILIGRLDAGARRMDFVSIPRDTYINKTVGGYTGLTRINAVYAAEYNRQVKSGNSKKNAKDLAIQDLSRRLSEALCVNIDE